MLHERLNNTRHLVDVAQCGLAAWQGDKSFSDVRGVGHVRLEVPKQVVSLIGGNSPLQQLRRYSSHANLVQFVDGGGYAGMEFGRDIVHLQQRAQHFSGIQAHSKIVDTGRGECLSQHQNNLSFRVDRATAYNIDIALVKLPEAPLPRPVGPPYGPDLIAPKQPANLLRITRDHAC